MEIKEKENRFVIEDATGRELGEMTWTNVGDNLMIIDHTFVNPIYRGQKLAGELVFAAVKKARKEHKKIIPLCPFAKKEFISNSDYNDVLKK